MKKFKAGDLVTIKSVEDITWIQEQDVYTFYNLDHDNYAGEQGVIVRDEESDIAPSYVIKLSDPDEPIVLPDFMLELVIKLTPETDAVFRDILRDT